MEWNNQHFSWKQALIIIIKECHGEEKCWYIHYVSIMSCLIVSCVDCWDIVEILFWQKSSGTGSVSFRIFKALFPMDSLMSRRKKIRRDRKKIWERNITGCIHNNNSVYLLSAHSIRFDAHGANYYYPGYARPSQRRTRQTRKNPTGTHLLHLGRERQLWIKCLV